MAGDTKPTTANAKPTPTNTPAILRPSSIVMFFVTRLNKSIPTENAIKAIPITAIAIEPAVTTPGIPVKRPISNAPTKAMAPPTAIKVPAIRSILSNVIILATRAYKPIPSPNTINPSPIKAKVSLPSSTTFPNIPNKAIAPPINIIVPTITSRVAGFFNITNEANVNTRSPAPNSTKPQPISRRVSVPSSIGFLNLPSKANAAANKPTVSNITGMNNIVGIINNADNANFLTKFQIPSPIAIRASVPALLFFSSNLSRFSPNCSIKSKNLLTVFLGTSENRSKAFAISLVPRPKSFKDIPAGDFATPPLSMFKAFPIAAF